MRPVGDRAVRVRRPGARAGATGRVAALAVAALAGWLACQRGPAPGAAGGAAPAMLAPPPAAGPGFVGSATCAGCHPREAVAYRGSDHARAMQPAAAETVLGDFAAAPLTHGDVTTTFFRRDGKFVVRTDGPDGRLGDFEIAYTFGIDPLQQYLVSFPGGRLQALGVAWDTRPRAQGGQRWLHLYPDARLVAPDPLHWTGREQTWNFQCAECHSTDLRKGYDAAGDRYTTTWAEITVGCEACHGPGATHVRHATTRLPGAPGPGAGGTGLLVRLGRGPGAWTIPDAARGIAAWRGAPRSAAEVDVCARCHARRRAIVDPYPYGRPFLDTHVPALLDADLYHADGQMRGEVYEYGSFVQSRMFRAGVTCSDCHDPHGLGLRAPGNRVCAPCHLPARFDTVAHHRHPPASEAARCPACHMPARIYMTVDTRRDHSFPVPRPDLAAAIGTPDVCTGCHRDRSATWAADTVTAWYGPPGPSRRPHFALALDAGRRGLLAAGAELTALAIDPSQPGIARATALELLADHPSRAALAALATGVGDGDPLVRGAALAALEAFPLDQRIPLGVPGLRDPVRAVRLAAARALAGMPASALSPDQEADLERALGELVASERVNADRPEAHLALAGLHLRLGQAPDAAASLRAALRLEPRFVPALIALADLHRLEGRDAEGERLLTRALEIDPDSAPVLHALGLRRVRQGRRTEAVDLLRRAAALRPDSSRLAYVHAVALYSTGDPVGAITALEAAHRRRPADREILVALATILRDRGDRERARHYAELLLRLTPEDPRVRALVESLGR